MIFQDGDYFGRTVNIAAHISAHANAGEVLVSDADGTTQGFTTFLERQGVPM